MCKFKNHCIGITVSSVRVISNVCASEEMTMSQSGDIDGMCYEEFNRLLIPQQRLLILVLDTQLHYKQCLGKKKVPDLSNVNYSKTYCI